MSKEKQTEVSPATDQLVSEIARLEKKFNIIVDHAESVEIWVLHDMRVAFISPGIERISGYTAEQFIKDPGLFRKMIHPDDLAEFNLNYEEFSESKVLVEIDLRIIRKEGEIRWIHTRMTKIYDDQGNYNGFRSSTTDITTLKETEKHLVDALSEIQTLKAKLEEENIYLRNKILSVKKLDGIITDSPLMNDVLEKVKQVAQTDSPVLIFGETGTGKELIAQAIHNASSRRKRLIITVNCSALPPSLIESELFGRERGAYTGALSRQIGRFEQANNSTIFLDEIGELPTEIQVKLLRVIQFGEFQKGRCADYCCHQ
jgi:formate hydrogenlyase transcriptional activator